MSEQSGEASIGFLYPALDEEASTQKRCLVTSEPDTVPSEERWAGGISYSHRLSGRRQPADTFRLTQKEQFRGIESHFQETIDKAHGRLEIRKHWLIDDLEQLSYLDEDGKWKGLRAIGMVESERHVGQQVERKRRSYLLSFGGKVQRFASSVRSHEDGAIGSTSVEGEIIDA